jgi:hypothetical protein
VYDAAAKLTDILIVIMRIAFSLIAGLFLAVPAYSQVFYHCTKDGKKLVTDRPCERFGATENKRINANDMPPLNTSKSLSENEKRQGQVVTDRLNQSGREHIQQRTYEKQKAAEEKKITEKKCADLWRYKQELVEKQRKRNSEWLNKEFRRVNDEIFRLNCGS